MAIFKIRQYKILIANLTRVQNAYFFLDLRNRWELSGSWRLSLLVSQI